MIPYQGLSRPKEARHREDKLNLLLNKIDLDSENQREIKTPFPLPLFPGSNTLFHSDCSTSHSKVAQLGWGMGVSGQSIMVSLCCSFLLALLQLDSPWAAEKSLLQSWSTSLPCSHLGVCGCLSHGGFSHSSPSPLLCRVLPFLKYSSPRCHHVG